MNCVAFARKLLFKYGSEIGQSMVEYDAVGHTNINSMSFEDAQDILGVTVDSSKDDIKKAYRNKVLRFHPDVNKNLSAGLDFQKLQQAYKILTSSKLLAEKLLNEEKEHLLERFWHVYNDVFIAKDLHKNYPNITSVPLEHAIEHVTQLCWEKTNFSEDTILEGLLDYMHKLNEDPEFFPY